jgi:translocation and assembly module TamB
MKRLFLILCLLLPLSLSAQTSEPDDRGFLEGLLEDNLSGAGRDVQIEGFRGALSSSATIDKLTIADAQGVWLTMTGIKLDWNRAALLTGALDVTELSAQELQMPRQPLPGPSLPDAEATPVEIPDLPVSVRIAKFSVPKAVLGAEILGQTAQLNVAGSATLNAGSASIDLAIHRQGTKSGEITLVAGFDKETRNIALDLSLNEPQGGLAASLLNIPETPPIILSVKGNGPVSGFVADILLSSQDQTRLSGQVSVGIDPESEDQTLFSAQLNGDIAPLFAPDYRPFFGSDPQLIAQGTRKPDGALELDAFGLRTDALEASGQMQITADGTATKLNLLAKLGADAGQPVLLPLPGSRTLVRSGLLNVRFDVAENDTWDISAQINDLTRDDLSLAQAQITAGGNYSQELLSGQIRANLNGIEPADDATSQALGQNVDLQTSLGWSKGEPVALSDLSLRTDHLLLAGAARIGQASAMADIDLWVDLVAQAPSLRPFTGLAGRRLAGAANVTAIGTIQPISGGFDLNVKGTTDDLAIDVARLDPFLAGRSVLDIRTNRDANGTRLATTLTNTFTQMQSHISLGDQAGSGFVRLEVFDLAPGLPELPGAANIDLQAEQDGQIWDVSAELTLPGQNQTTVTAQIESADLEDVSIAATAGLNWQNLDRFAKLSGQALAGQLKGQIDGHARLSDQSFDLRTDLNASGLQVGIELVDTLLKGSVTAKMAAARNGNGFLTIKDAHLRSDQGELTVSSSSDTTLSIAASLRDLGILAPELNGAARLSGKAELKGTDWHLNLSGNGPGGANVTATGSIAGDGSHTDMSLRGTGPLALANGFIRPMSLSGMARYDLTLKGPPSLQAAGGQILVQEARVVLPAQRLALEGLSASISLGQGAAQVNLEGKVTTGGTVTLNGPVNLTAPYRADLDLQLTDVILTDPSLFETSVNGPLSVTGGLTKGALIAGQLRLGPTELRVPNPSGAEQADLPGLQHVNTPAVVQQTRRYAGLIQTDSSENSTGGSFGLDLRILAPDRIFVRGRGLDAELGGSLALKGDTNNVLPEGRFDLIRGRLDILGKRFSLTEGLVQLQGAFDPFVRFAASTETGNTTATVAIEGQASTPELSFTSSPSLPQDEVLALILFGKDLSTISPLQAVRLAAAVRTLAGKGGDGISSKVRRGLALDDLDVTTSDTGATEARAGKYISENIYSEVTVDSDGNSQINLNLSINRSVTARGRLASDGETGIGVFVEKDY